MHVHVPIGVRGPPGVLHHRTLEFNCTNCMGAVLFVALIEGFPAPWWLRHDVYSLQPRYVWRATQNFTAKPPVSGFKHQVLLLDGEFLHFRQHVEVACQAQRDESWRDCVHSRSTQRTWHVRPWVLQHVQHALHGSVADDALQAAHHSQRCPENGLHTHTQHTHTPYV